MEGEEVMVGAQGSFFLKFIVVQLQLSAFPPPPPTPPTQPRVLEEVSVEVEQLGQ